MLTLLSSLILSGIFCTSAFAAVITPSRTEISDTIKNGTANAIPFFSNRQRTLSSLANFPACSALLRSLRSFSFFRSLQSFHIQTADAKLPSLSRLGHPLFPLMKKAVHFRELLFSKTGNDLFSQAVSRQVSSALKSLTSVFGMGTGGSSSPLSPDFILSFLSTQTMKNLSSLTSLRLSPSLG